MNHDELKRKEKGDFQGLLLGKPPQTEQLLTEKHRSPTWETLPLAPTFSAATCWEAQLILYACFVASLKVDSYTRALKGCVFHVSSMCFPLNFSAVRRVEVTLTNLVRHLPHLRAPGADDNGGPGRSLEDSDLETLSHPQDQCLCLFKSRGAPPSRWASGPGGLCWALVFLSLGLRVPGLLEEGETRLSCD